MNLTPTSPRTVASLLLAGCLSTTIFTCATAQDAPAKTPREGDKPAERGGREPDRQNAERRGAQSPESGRERGAESRDQTRAMRELAQRQEHLARQFEEMRAKGNEKEAAEVKEQIAKLARQREEMARAGGDGDRGNRPEGGFGDRRGPRQEGQADPQQRLQHLEAAINHLRQAGFTEPAEQFAGEAQRMREQIPGAMRGQPQGGPRGGPGFGTGGPGGPGFGPGNPGVGPGTGPEPARTRGGTRVPGFAGAPGPGGQGAPVMADMERLRDEVSRLQRAVEELRGKMEEVSRQRKQ